MRTINKAPKFYSRHEAAALTGLSLSTVDRHLKTGAIESVRIPGGRRVLIPSATIDRMADPASSGRD